MLQSHHVKRMQVCYLVITPRAMLQSHRAKCIASGP